MSDDELLEELTEAIAGGSDIRTSYDPQNQEVKVVADDLAKAILPNVKRIINNRATPPIPKKEPKRVSIRDRLCEAFKAGYNTNSPDVQRAFEKWLDDERKKSGS